jgi:hypothetical protein
MVDLWVVCGGAGRLLAGLVVDIERARRTSATPCAPTQQQAESDSRVAWPPMMPAVQ